MDAQERRSICGSRTTGAPMRRLRPAGGTGGCLSVARMSGPPEAELGLYMIIWIIPWKSGGLR
eukprot:1176090-Prymnesium_polylepis.1